MLDVQGVWGIIIDMLLAAAGGFARLLTSKDQMALRTSRILSELFVSGFAGVMVLLLAKALGVTGDWLGLVCGMAGWVGPRILDLVAKPAGKVIGIDIDSAKNADTPEEQKAPEAHDSNNHNSEQS